MANFDMDGYLQRKFGNAGNDKILALQEASANKVQALQEISNGIQASKDTWVNKLGLDPEGIAGSAVNLAASLTSGTSRVVGQIASLPTSIASAQAEYGVTDDATQAYARYKQGTATPEDNTLLQQRGLSGLGGDGPTQLEQLQQGEKFRKASRDMVGATDLTGIVDQTKRQQLSQDLGDDFEQSWNQVKDGYEGFKKGHLIDGTADTISGIAKLLFNAGEAAVTNPGAASEYIVENIPQLAIGAFGKAGMIAMNASNLGYGADLYQQGVENWQKKHNGELPPVEERQKIAMNAAGAVVMESVGDHLGLGFAKAGKLAKGIPEAEAKAIKTGFIQSLKNVGKASGGGLGSESFTEGVQTYLEGEATGKEATAKDIYEGAVVGGIAGAGLSGGGRVLAEGAKATPEHAEKRAQDRQALVDRVQATLDNDPSAYLDPKSKSFDPVKAISVLHGHAKLEGITPEAKTENLEKAHRIVMDLETKRNQLFEVTPQGLAENQALLAQEEAKLAAATTPEEKAEAQEMVGLYKAGIAEVEALPPKQLKANAQQLDQLDQQLASVRQATHQLSVEAQPKPEEVTAVIEQADQAPDVEASKPAVSRVLTLAMAHPDSLPTEAINRLVKNQSNGITPDQRELLRNISEARRLENHLKGLKGVSKEVLEGDPDKNQLGIKQYKARVTEALLGGNQKQADRQLGLLASFATNHAAKAKLFADVHAEVQGTNRQVQLVPLKNGKWAIADQVYPTREELAAVGGMTVHSNSTKLVNAIRMEAKTLQQTKAQLDSAYKLKFAPAPSTAIEPVVNSVESSNAVAEATSVVEQTSQGQLQSKGDNSVDMESPSTQAVEESATNTVQDAPVNSSLVEEASAAYTDRTFRELDDKEQSLVDKATVRLKGFFGKELASLKGVIIQEGMPPGGAYLSDLGVISLDPRLFTHKVKNLDIQEEDRVVRVLAHELSHMRDMETSEEKDGETVFGSERVAAYNPGGLLYNEIYAVMQQDTQEGKRIAKWFEYAMREEEAAHHIPTELFAQLNALYIVNPQLMEDALPYAYEAISNTYSENQSRVAETVSRDDGTGSRSIGEEATDQVESEAEETEVSLGPVSGKLKLYEQLSQYVSGKLGEVVDVVKGTQAFQTLNLVREFLTQEVGNGKTKRPLVAEANFLQSWIAGKTSPEQYLSDPLTEAQEKMLNDFKAKAEKWLPLIQKNLIKGKFVQKRNTIEDPAEFRFQDPVQFLVEREEGSNRPVMEENVKTAIAQAAYGWVAENAGGSIFNSEEAIKAMFGGKDYDEISMELVDALRDVGNLEKSLILSMGQRVTQALGFKENEKATQEFLPRLQGALGVHVMKLLLDTGVVERNEVDTQVIKDGLPERLGLGIKVGEHTTMGFLRLARNPGKTYRERTLKETAQQISDVVKGTQGVFSKLFGVEAEKVAPSWKPIKSKQKTTKNTDQKVPALQQKIIDHENAVPSKLRQDMWGLFNTLDKFDFLRMAGWKDLDESKMHSRNYRSQEAKNEALEREYDDIQEYFDMVEKDAPNQLNQSIYFPHDVWKQQRVGIKSYIDPQGSKLHRHMLFRPDWETEVSSTDEGMMANFWLRVGEGLGVKTDKQANETSLEKLTQVLDTQSPDEKVRDRAIVIRAAVDALKIQATSADGISAEEKAAITAGILAAGEDLHSLDALVTLADYELAREKAQGQDFTFTSRLMGEVDGVTNGPMLSHLLLGAKEQLRDLVQLLNKGGFFNKDAGFKNYNVYRGSPNKQDLYETTTAGLINDMNQMQVDAPAQIPVYKALYAITGNLTDDAGKVTGDGRNIIKTPLTAMMFGSAIDGAVGSMFKDFVSKIYGRIEDVAKAPVEKQEAMGQQLIADINTLLKASNRNPEGIDPDTSITDLLAHDFERYPAQLQALEATFNNTFGKAVHQTMERDFGTFLARRDQINKTAQATFDLYYAIYQGVREQYLQELIGSTDVAAATGKKGDKIPRHVLTKPQEKELQERLKAINPVVHTYFSKFSDADLESGLHMSSTSRKLSTETAYQSQIRLGSPMPDTGDVNFHMTAYQRAMENPGVSMVSMLTHSLDSAISHLSVDGTQVLNVHDANGTGLKYFTRTAQRLNENTWKATLNYSPASEMRDAFQRTIEGMASMLEGGEVTPKTIKNLRKVLDDLAIKHKPKGTKEALAPELVLDLLMQEMYSTAYAADTTKLQLMKELHYIDQYALEGGQYNVSKQDRAEAAKMLKALQAQIPAELQAKIDLINQKVLGVKPAAKPVLETSVWGELGTSSIPTNPVIEARFQKHPVMSGVEALRLAYASLGKTYSTEQAAFYRQLLEQVSKKVPKNLTVTYISKKTPADKVVSPDGQQMLNARGWYVDTQNGNIYVLGSEFKSSGLDAELLIHEVLHATLTKVIENDQSEDVRALVKDLETLQQKAKEYIEQNFTEEEQAKYLPAVSNVHELVAWGMSNQDFQEKVLEHVVMRSKTRQNKLITGMKAFIESVIGILFRDTNKTTRQINETGMAVLLRNTAGLLNASGQQAQATGTVHPMVNTSTAPTNYTTHQIYESLGALTGFDSQHQMLLNNIVDKLHGPYGVYKTLLQQEQAITPTDVWVKAKLTGVAPFASKLLASGIKISEKEAFVIEQVEATVTAALDGKNGEAVFGYKELAKLYAEARSKLTPDQFLGAEWGTTTPDEAKAIHDFLFKVSQNSDGTSNYLARFAALGLAHEGFNKLLQFNTDKVAKLTGKHSFVKRLETWFEQALEWLGGKMTHTQPGQLANSKLLSLVGKLVDIEAKKQADMAMTEMNYMAPVEDAIKGVSQKARTQIEKLGRSSVFQGPKNPFLNAAGNVASMVAGDRVDQFMANFTKLRDTHFKEAHGLFAGIINEIQGANPMNQVFHTMLRASKLREGKRKDIIDGTAATVLKSFAEEGKNLTETDKAAITASFLRTDMMSLLDGRSMDDLHTLMNSSSALQKEIIKIESQLSGSKDVVEAYIKSAKLLAYQMTSGQARGNHVMLNAHTLARLSGTPFVRQIPEMQARKMQPLLDQLVSLRAIEYTPTTHLVRARKVLLQENGRGGENGVEMVLKLHKTLQDQSRERLFEDGEALMMKGYTPEIYDPHRTLLVANEQDGKKLIAQGFVQKGLVSNDPKDPDQQSRGIYVRDGAAGQQYLSAIFSTTDTHKKGSRAKNTEVMDMNSWILNQEDLSDMQKAKYSVLRQELTGDPHFDPRKAKVNYSVPVMNSKGQVVEYRYLMQEVNKDSLLDRNNRVETVMGVLAGSLFDKETTKTSNRKAVQALKDQYDQEYTLKPESYVRIGDDSPKAEFREIYAMLPGDTQQAIKEIWGDEGMMVRIDLLDINFGYRKLSITDAFKKDTKARNFAERALVDIMTQVAGDKASWYLGRAEEVWDTLVQETKDTLVIKSYSTLKNNIISNVTALIWNGVGPVEMLKHHRVALRGATMYRKDSEELMTLQTKLDAGYIKTDKTGIEARIVQLQDSLARNPVRDLIDAGLLPSIVEDINPEDDKYSYKARFSKTVREKTQKLNPKILAAGKVVYMAHDTKMYKALRHATQLSDFLARYTLYQHLTTRKTDPVSKEKALQQADATFINYDVPSHRVIQALNDKGLVWFTKYYLRIQKVIAQLYRDNPARAMMLLSLEHYFGAVPTLMDSSATHSIGRNPFSTGAFKFLGTWDDLATVKMGMSPFN